VSAQLGLAIEGLVAILLTVTIGYCYMLNKRLGRLRADEQTLKATISELITATEIAERAIAGLKLTVQECDHSLGQRLKAADAAAADLASQTASADQLVGKLAQIAGVAKPANAVPSRSGSPDANATVAAAQAFVARARARAHGAAA
jgi:hypothetical protein